MKILPIILAITFLAGCASDDEEVVEGQLAGSCSDGADNDGDSLFDCNDPGCALSPDCEEVADGGVGGVTDSDIGGVTDSAVSFPDGAFFSDGG